MMNKIIYMVFIFAIFSCESKVKYDKPENLIPKDQMIDLLYDMHLADGTSGVKNKNLENNRNYMALVYKKHNIDSSQFAVSNKYYIANIKEYKDIFEEVEKRLLVLQNQYQNERDSIIKAAKEKHTLDAPKKKIYIGDSILR